MCGSYVFIVSAEFWEDSFVENTKKSHRFYSAATFILLSVVLTEKLLARWREAESRTA